MVEQNRSGVFTEIVYAPNGAKLALMNGTTLTKAFVPLPAGAAAVYNSSGLAYYRHSDWLGSSRFASTPARAMYFDGAYAPFGEPYAQTGTTDLSFTGQNQDTVSALYDFPARDYGIQGRWPSPDPIGLAAANPTDPQSFNRYAYVLNGSLGNTDPSGLCVRVARCLADDVRARLCGVAYLCNFDPFDLLNIPVDTGALFTDTQLTNMEADLETGNSPFYEILDPGAQASEDTASPGDGDKPQAPVDNSDPTKLPTCISVFGKATLNALNPASPSLATPGEAATSFASAVQYNGALNYAAAKGLAYPLKSSVFRSMMAGAQDTAAAALPLTLVLAEAQGLFVELSQAAKGACRASF